MIKQHAEIIEHLFQSIEDIENTITDLPEGREKYQLEARAEMLKEAAEIYTENTLDLYDMILTFATGIE